MAALRRFLLLPRLRLITCVSAASLLILFSRDFSSRMKDERHKRDFNNFSEIPAESAAIDPTAIDPTAIDPTAIDPTAIDPTAIDLTPLVNTLINSSQSGSRQLFSLLSVSSYSALDLHKLTLLVYNISSLKSVESRLFRRRFCYCVTNDTNDLTDFTAILLDVMGNSTSFLQELFKSSSILSVSQRNNSDCIYICVMAGKTGRELSGFWDDGSVTPLFNQTIVEGPNRVANISSIRLPAASPHLSRTSSTTLKVTTSVEVTATSSRPPGFTAGRPSTETPNIRTSQSVSTPQIRTAGAAEATSAGTTRRPTSSAAAAPPAAAATSAAAGGATGVATAAAPAPALHADTARPPAATAPAPAPPAATARPPAATSAAAGITAAPALPAVTARPPAAAITSAAAITAAGITAIAAPALPEVTARPPAATFAATAAGVTAAPAPPAATAALKSPDSLVDTSISPTSPLQTTFTGPSTLRPAETTPSSRDTTSDRAGETERPGCLWRRREPGGEAETLGELKLQPCVLELCRFFSQCLCRPLSRTTRSKRYCDDSFLWYEEHTFEVCRRVKRVSFSRNLKQRCLSKMCNKL